jgi:hypothetical protein
MQLFEAEYLLAYQPSNSWVHFDVWPDVWMVAAGSESFQGGYGCARGADGSVKCARACSAGVVLLDQAIE